MLFLHLLNLVCFLLVSTHGIMFEQGKVCVFVYIQTIGSSFLLTGSIIEGNFLSKLFIQVVTKAFRVSCSMPMYIISLVRDIVQAI